MKFKYLFLIAWVFITETGWCEDIYIVTNKKLNISSVNKEDISKVYLGKSSTLGSAKVEPLALPSDSQDHQIFTTDVLGKDPQTYEKYWARKVFTGKGVPPKTVSNEKDRIDYVKQNENAVFYTITPPTDPEMMAVIVK